ncbi:TIGR03084 family metal-binding protein [Streptomyces sp. NPDC014892]|uniref:TIGR03084 family metal-binding protein n=1 Tax=Streptomyces sp. NPDC014892 TaxID=3364930 RepID=UPI0036F8AE4A
MPETVGGVPGELLDDLVAEYDSLRALVVPGTDLRSATPAEGWDVGAGVAHLAGCDRLAADALAHPDEFERARPVTDEGLASLLDAHITVRRTLPVDALRADWAEQFTGLITALRLSRRGQKVPWFGPPMSPATLATARVMEYWAHGQDIADGLGIAREATDRIRHVCHLGFATFGFSFAHRGLPVPDTVPRLDLRLPSGAAWSRGADAGTGAAISGDALEFALVVTQRRNHRDTSLVAHGDVARHWLEIAQCFAGPPGPGRPATTG